MALPLHGTGMGAVEALAADFVTGFQSQYLDDNQQEEFQCAYPIPG